MSETKIFAQIHSAGKITKGTYLIDIEVTSLSNDGIKPNVDFIIKANELSRNRVTNSSGVYRGDEIFKSEKDIEYLQFFDNDELLLSKCYVPHFNETNGITKKKKKKKKKSNKKAIFSEIGTLINDLTCVLRTQTYKRTAYLSTQEIDSQQGTIIVKCDVIFNDYQNSELSKIFQPSYCSFSFDTIYGCSKLYYEPEKPHGCKYYFDLYANFKIWEEGGINKSENSYRFGSDYEQIKNLHKIFTSIDKKNK